MHIRTTYYITSQDMYASRTFNGCLESHFEKGPRCVTYFAPSERPTKQIDYLLSWAWRVRAVGFKRGVTFPVSPHATPLLRYQSVGRNKSFRAQARKSVSGAPMHGWVRYKVIGFCNCSQKGSFTSFIHTYNCCNWSININRLRVLNTFVFVNRYLC